MVSFRTIIASALALSVTAAQVTPAQIVSNIGRGPFPEIITGFVDIVSTATTAISQMDGMAPVAAGAGSDKIYDAFREVRFPTHFANTANITFQQFVRVHQALLNILIGKAGLFETVPYIGQPLAQVLRQVEGVVDVRYIPFPTARELY
jgi:hypothetical protein